MYKCPQDLYMLPGQLSSLQMTSVKYGQKNLPLRFGQHRVSNSGDFPDMEKCHLDKCFLQNEDYPKWRQAQKGR